MDLNSNGRIEDDLMQYSTCVTSMEEFRNFYNVKQIVQNESAVYFALKVQYLL